MTGTTAPSAQRQGAPEAGSCTCAQTPDTTHPGRIDPGCAPCVARPSPLPERVASVQAAIVEETEPLVTLTHLLQLCRDEHPVLWERLNDPAVRAQVAVITADVLAVLPAEPALQVLETPVRQALAAALAAAGPLPAVVVARALAELIDDRYFPSFTESFRRRSPYQPGVGDPIPLDSPDLRQVTDLPATSPPWRLANRLDQTRHLRLAGGWAAQFQVIFDYGHAQVLAGLIGPDTVIATCHPNRRLDEFDFPVDSAGLTFPVRPVDLQRQQQEIDRLIRAAVAAGASIVVLPELCVTSALAAQLQEWTCRPDGPRLLVAGSYHHEDPHGAAEGSGRSEPQRRNTAIAFLRDCPAPMIHDKHSPADSPINEDIQPSGWPQLRVHVSDDGWHLVIAICRDLLNPHAVHALTEAGVNVALVPAMSETMVAFGGPVAQMVGATQAFVAVANNPADFSTTADAAVRRPARAIFGHPGFGQQTRLVQPNNGEPGVALLRVRTGQLQWLSAAPARPASGRGARQPLPPWAVALAGESERSSRAERQPSQPILRPAAVLVLLADSPHGPAVLLTERAPDLTHYPGQLVFPGGAAEEDDDGAIDTALREATEETGLDPSSVQILGTLPALALPDSGFLLTPVLAWSAGPRFTGSPNLAEVSAMGMRALRSAAHPGPGLLSDASGPETADSPPAPLGAVTRVVIDLVVGMLTRTANRPASTAVATHGTRFGVCATAGVGISAFIDS